MKYVFIEEISGVSQKSNKPYNLLKLADPNTYENHVISYDPLAVPHARDFKRGEMVTVNGELRTPFGNTQFIATGLKKAV